MANTPNFEVDNILSINNNNKIIATKHRSPHANISPNLNGKKNDDGNDELDSTKSISKESQRNSADEIGVAYISPINNVMNKTTTRAQTSEQQSTQNTTKNKGEGSRVAKYGKVNGASSSQLPSNASNNNVEGSYHCQFCDKSFPRLGYLKKHEQVSYAIFLLLLLFCLYDEC